MGFPDYFKIHDNLGESYKQVGNSVCIPMVAEIAHQLKEQIFACLPEEKNLNQFISGRQEVLVQYN